MSMSLTKTGSKGTLLTHVNRVRQNNPELYEEVRRVRKAQIAMRHMMALDNAKAHSRAYFRRKNRQMRRLGYSLW